MDAESHERMGERDDGRPTAREARTHGDRCDGAAVTHRHGGDSELGLRRRLDADQLREPRPIGGLQRGLDGRQHGNAEPRLNEQHQLRSEQPDVRRPGRRQPGAIRVQRVPAVHAARRLQARRRLTARGPVSRRLRRPGGRHRGDHDAGTAVRRHQRVPTVRRRALSVPERHVQLLRRRRHPRRPRRQPVPQRRLCRTDRVEELQHGRQPQRVGARLGVLRAAAALRRLAADRHRVRRQPAQRRSARDRQPVVHCLGHRRPRRLQGQGRDRRDDDLRRHAEHERRKVRRRRHRRIERGAHVRLPAALPPGPTRRHPRQHNAAEGRRARGHGHAADRGGQRIDGPRADDHDDQSNDRQRRTDLRRTTGTRDRRGARARLRDGSRRADAGPGPEA